LGTTFLRPFQEKMLEHEEITKFWRKIGPKTVDSFLRYTSHALEISKGTKNGKIKQKNNLS
jgi:hypothetical protein